MNKYKKPLLIALLVLDVAITVFLFVISIIFIIMVAKYGVKYAPNHADGLIKYFLQNPNIFGFTCVISMFVILAANIVGLVFYVKKTSSKQSTKLDDLSDEQKEALRQELLKDLMNGSNKVEPKVNKEE